MGNQWMRIKYPELGLCLGLKPITHYCIHLVLPVLGTCHWCEALHEELLRTASVQNTSCKGQPTHEPELQCSWVAPCKLDTQCAPFGSQHCKAHIRLTLHLEFQLAGRSMVEHQQGCMPALISRHGIPNTCSSQCVLAQFMPHCCRAGSQVDYLQSSRWLHRPSRSARVLRVYGAWGGKAKLLELRPSWFH